MKEYKRWKIVHILLAAFVLCGCRSGSGEIHWDDMEESNYETESNQETKEEWSETEVVIQSVFVDICGAVKRPGVYELEEGARVYQVIELAGGLLPEADDTAINRAEVLMDGMKIQIFTVDEMKEARSSQVGIKSGSQGQTEVDQKVNINTADASQLSTLSGIGQSRASDIIAYRNEHGSFQSIEEIMNVAGIKEATYNKIKDKITTE